MFYLFLLWKRGLAPNFALGEEACLRRLFEK